MSTHGESSRPQSQDHRGLGSRLSQHKNPFFSKIRKRWNAAEASRRSTREIIRERKIRRDQKRKEDAAKGEGPSDRQWFLKDNQNEESSAEEDTAKLYPDTESDDIKDPRTKKKRQILRDPLSLDSDFPSSKTSLRQFVSPDMSTPLALKRNEERYKTDVLHPSSVSSSFGYEQQLTIAKELLKYIHWFASEYYTSRRWLASQPVQRPKQKVIEKSMKEEGRGECAGDRNTPDADGDECMNQSSEELSDLQMNGSQAPRQWNSRRGRRRASEVDMYRILDGSALMAMGALFHVAAELQR